jgi:hypothetical protein
MLLEFLMLRIDEDGDDRKRWQQIHPNRKAAQHDIF